MAASFTPLEKIPADRESNLCYHSSENIERGEVVDVNNITTTTRIELDSFAHLDQKKILRKMDIRLIPMLALLYLLSFLDRGNIGNAKIEGLQEDLNMTPDQYNWCLTVFFFTYAAFEVPSNLLLKKLRPSIWLPTIMVAWGVVMTLMGIVKNYHGLLVARIFLGYYLTMWYCRHEIQLRQALFFSAASVAGAFSGLLAFGIAKMDGVGGLEGWRWIFILEGIVTVLVAIMAYFTLFDFPDTASFLTEEERAFVVFRLKYQSAAGKGREGIVLVAEAEEFRWEYVWAAFKDWQVWINIFVYWGIGVGNLGGAMASNFYRAKDSPRYIIGHALEIGFICAGIIATFILVCGYNRINNNREKQMAQGAANHFSAEESASTSVETTKEHQDRIRCYNRNQNRTTGSR
ncbi:unnamed protein product [Parascedosporium putredinis]|uniref:Major facilitator superfamily (MFS) profile domain-containing protein n=1 Tax=Parascedosporium putredinis TaxID=1442378 RepID=A0A9P1GWN4_9PEZI|nr:unnamed protein product [Parascedosporium putredinis]CAI7988360.1 unnamed protein product [Parascedosporium putredinis]